MNVCKRFFTLLALLIGPASFAADPVQIGKVTSWSGTGTGDGTTVVEATTAQGIAHTANCQLYTTTGAVVVYLSLDGSTYATAAYSMQDFGATDGLGATVTTALRIYGFVHGAASIKLVQSGGTTATAVMNCWPD